MEDVLHQLDKASIDFDSAVARMRVELIEARNQKAVLGKILDVLQQMQSVLADVRNQVRFSGEVMKQVAGAQRVENPVTVHPLDEEELRKACLTTASEKVVPEPMGLSGNMVVLSKPEKVPGVLMKEEVAQIEEKIASMPPPPKVEKPEKTRKPGTYNGKVVPCCDCKTPFQKTGPRSKRCAGCTKAKKDAALKRFKDSRQPAPAPEPAPEPVPVETVSEKKGLYEPRHCSRMVRNADRKWEKCDTVFVPETKRQIYCGRCTKELATQMVPQVPGQVSSAIPA